MFAHLVSQTQENGLPKLPYQPHPALSPFLSPKMSLPYTDLVKVTGANIYKAFRMVPGTDCMFMYMLSKQEPQAL